MDSKKAAQKISVDKGYVQLNLENKKRLGKEGQDYVVYKQTTTFRQTSKIYYYRGTNWDQAYRWYKRE